MEQGQCVTRAEHSPVACAAVYLGQWHSLLRSLWVTDHAENTLLGIGIQWRSKGETIAGHLASFSSCCGSSGGSQPGLLVTVPGALRGQGCFATLAWSCRSGSANLLHSAGPGTRQRLPQPHWHVLGPCPRPSSPGLLHGHTKFEVGKAMAKPRGPGGRRHSASPL